MAAPARQPMAQVVRNNLATHTAWLQAQRQSDLTDACFIIDLTEAQVQSGPPPPRRGTAAPRRADTTLEQVLSLSVSLSLCLFSRPSLSLSLSLSLSMRPCVCVNVCVCVCERVCV